MNESIEYVSALPLGTLLIFYGLGITLVGIGLHIKLEFLSKEHDLPEASILSCKGVFYLAKSLCNWASGYLIAGICIMIASSINESSQFLRPFLFNISFGLSLIVTAAIAFVYARYILFSRILDLAEILKHRI